MEINDFVIVKKSNIHGLGLFARIDIPANTRIGDYIGEEMSRKEFKSKYGDDIHFTYSLGRTHKIIVGKKQKYLFKNPSHFCNESKNPNAFLQKRGLYTSQNVKKGEEIFLKYLKRYPRDYVL